MNEERTAVLEANQVRIQEDIMQLFKLIRDHMAHEEIRWDEIQRQLSEIKNERSKDRGFVAGMIFAASAFWAVIITGLTFWLKH